MRNILANARATGLPFNESVCGAKTKSGGRCQNQAGMDGRCWLHQLTRPAPADPTPHSSFFDYIRSFPERFLPGWPKADPWSAYFVVVHPVGGRSARWFVLSPMRDAEYAGLMFLVANWYVGTFPEAVISVWRHGTGFLQDGAIAECCGFWQGERAKKND